MASAPRRLTRASALEALQRLTAEQATLAAILGLVDGESLLQAARRVVAERDAARRVADGS